MLCSCLPLSLCSVWNMGQAAASASWSWHEAWRALRKWELLLSLLWGAFGEGGEWGLRPDTPEGAVEGLGCQGLLPALALTCPQSFPEPRTGRSLGTQSLTHQGPMWPPPRSVMTCQ